MTVARSPPSLVPPPWPFQAGVAWFRGQVPGVRASRVCEGGEIHDSSLGQELRLSPSAGLLAGDGAGCPRRSAVSVAMWRPAAWSSLSRSRVLVARAGPLLPVCVSVSWT